MAPVTAEYVPAKVSDEKNAYIDSNTKSERVGIHNERRRQKDGGGNTFHSKKSLIANGTRG